MSFFACVGWLADLIGVCFGELNDSVESFSPEVRLISQNNGKVGQVRFPTTPARGTKNRTEHSALGKGIRYTGGRRKAEMIELVRQELIIVRANDCNLTRFQ